MPYIDSFGLWENQKVRYRVTMALIKAARDVANEAGNTANHANRLAYAKFLLRAADAEAESWRWYVLSDALFYDAVTNPATDEGWRDAKLDEAIAGGFNVFANLYVAQ